MIVASCGHELTKKEGFGKSIIIKSWTRENERAYDCMQVCNKCFNLYKKEGYVLTRKEAEKWIHESL